MPPGRGPSTTALLRAGLVSSTACETLPVAQAVLEVNPARNTAVVDGPRPGGMEFDALLRRAGIRYEDLV